MTSVELGAPLSVERQIGGAFSGTNSAGDSPHHGKGVIQQERSARYWHQSGQTCPGTTLLVTVHTIVRVLSGKRGVPGIGIKVVKVLFLFQLELLVSPMKLRCV